MKLTVDDYATIIRRIHEIEEQIEADASGRFIQHDLPFYQPAGDLATALGLDPEPLLDAPVYRVHTLRIIYDRKTDTLVSVVDQCCREEK